MPININDRIQDNSRQFDGIVIMVDGDQVYYRTDHDGKVERAHQGLVTVIPKEREIDAAAKSFRREALRKKRAAPPPQATARLPRQSRGRSNRKGKEPT